MNKLKLELNREFGTHNLHVSLKITDFLFWFWRMCQE